ncbi:Regulator of microtubule dynamics protein 2 [Bulinus truncatus]|nr:Regulator of microtubule dynamics protein 2 [Bulinus truncatus]
MSVVSKVFLASGLVAVGSGITYIIYQQYIFIERGKRLQNHLNNLTLRIAKLEGELKKIKENLASSSSTEGTEEIFVDASEVATTQITGDRRESLKSDDVCFDATKKCDEENIFTSLANIDKLLEQVDYENLTDAFSMLTDLIAKHPDVSEFQWRLAKVCFLLASEGLIKNSDQPNCTQSELMKTAQEAARRALELDDKSGDAHKWMAIVLGSITQFLPVQEQIRNAYDIKSHIQSAIKYKPNDSLPYHMLGRWCYSVYMLTWVERKVAATLFATPPTATIEEAIEHLLKAEEISPEGSIDNALYLGKAYLAKKDYEKAVMWWRSGSRMTSSKTDDVKALAEIQDLLTQYESYAQS